MHKLSTAHWAQDEKLEGLLYFAQRGYEMLFDYSLDSYKAPTLNSASLVLEAKSIIREIEDQRATSSNLKFVIDELIWSVTEDEVAKKLIPFEFKEFSKKLCTNDFEETKVAVTLLSNWLNIPEYVNQTKQSLREAIIENKKLRIEKLAGSLITSLRNAGFTSNHLFRELRKTFFRKSRKVEDFAQLDAFLDACALQDREYNAFFICSNLISDVTDLWSVFDLSLPNEQEQEIVKAALGVPPDNRLIVKIGNLKKLDAVSARNEAENRLEAIKSLFVFAHHRSWIEWEQEAFVTQPSGSNVALLGRPVRATRKIYDYNTSKAARLLRQLGARVTMQHDTWVVIESAFRLHSTAVTGDQPQNQLLNLWTALETLIPLNSEKATIPQIIDSLTPFLMISYVPRLIRTYAADFARWNFGLFKSILQACPKDQTIEEKLAWMLSTEEGKPLREKVYAESQDYVLLRNRTYKLHKDLSNRRALKKLFEIHEKKIRWQITRIYRARNLIVHGANHPPFLPSLVENAHYYVDVFIVEFLNAAARGSKINSIQESIFATKLRWRSIGKEVSRNPGHFQKSDIHTCLIVDIC